MTKEITYFATIALAEQAIIDQGYVRDRQRAVWVSFGGKTAKVVRAEDGKFYVEWS